MIQKKELNIIYPNWNIKTMDLYTNLSDKSVDIKIDICSKNFNIKEKFNLIINQAILEHVYNPFEAMNNLSSLLQLNGYLISHTCSRNYGYHQWPRDYIRFMLDWWYDLPNYIKDIKLVELYDAEDIGHVFTCYQKIIN